MDFQKQYDVVVAGAGVAGVAAALECARRGLRVALLEKTILPGGLATSGLVNIYLPLCDGNGTQVTYGLAEELLRLSIKYGPGDIPDWRQAPTAGGHHARFLVAFSPGSYVLALDEALEAAGVDTWYDTLLCRAVLQGARVTGVEVENKSGRGRLDAVCFIDATGDADLAFRAGAPCAEADNWLSMWAQGASLAGARMAVERSDGTPLLGCYRTGGDCDGNNLPPGTRKWYGTRGADVTGMVLAGRRLLRNHYQAQYAAGVRRHDLFSMTLPTMAQFRTTRRIVGNVTLADGQHGQRFADSIGLAADWRKPGFVWEIPYATLLPQTVTGLLVAGRCLSSAGDAWEVTRVIPIAALTGQAAGVAATLAVQGATTPDAVTATQVQQRLRAAGVPFHLAEVYPAV